MSRLWQDADACAAFQKFNRMKLKTLFNLLAKTTLTPISATHCFASGNLQVNPTWAAGSDSNSIQIPGTDTLSVEANGLNPPPYAYTLDPAADIPGAVTNNAGAGKGPFAP